MDVVGNPVVPRRRGRHRGYHANISISSSSIKFMVDNESWDVAAWACDASCFANNPTQQIGQGIGELEIKPESLLYVVCTTRDFAGRQ
jgi:hypothetical protein